MGAIPTETDWATALEALHAEVAEWRADIRSALCNLIPEKFQTEGKVHPLDRASESLFYFLSRGSFAEINSFRHRCSLLHQSREQAEEKHKSARQEMERYHTRSQATDRLQLYRAHSKPETTQADRQGASLYLALHLARPGQIWFRQSESFRYSQNLGHGWYRRSEYQLGGD